MPYGKLAEQYCGVQLNVRVLKSGAGHYIGCFDADPMSPTFGPVSRESQYFPTEAAAQEALSSGNWTQRLEP